MREIKFRALVPVNTDEPKMMMYYDLVNFDDLNRLAVEDWDINQLMQFTGLHDCNGKEIYEGDICRVLYTDWGSKDANDPRSIEKYMQDISKIGKVEFEEYEWQFNFGFNRYGEVNYGTFHVGAHGRIEVIGNIYENKEN